MSESTQNSSGGIDIIGLLGVCFVVLKLIGVISWSWWWVLAPFWALPTLIAAILLLVLIAGFFIDV